MEREDQIGTPCLWLYISFQNGRLLGQKHHSLVSQRSAAGESLPAAIGSFSNWAPNSETQIRAEHNNGCQTKRYCGAAKKVQWVVGRVVDAPGGAFEGSSQRGVTTGRQSSLISLTGFYKFQLKDTDLTHRTSLFSMITDGRQWQD